MSECGGREHLQCTRHAHACTHIRGRIHELWSALSLSLPPSLPSWEASSPASPSGERSLSLSPSSNTPLEPPGHVCLYRTLWYIRTYCIYIALVTSVTREPLSRIRASPSYGARRRKYINRPHSRRYRQLLLPPSSRLWVNHRHRVCPAC